MAGSFDKAFEFILWWEGGEVNDPDDPGGHTKYGISNRAYPYLDIGRLTLTEAKNIYRDDYWYAGKCHEMPDAIALFHFDCCVNQGVGRAARFLQQSVGVPVDGKIGAVTVGAVKAAPLKETLREYSAKRAAHYAKLNPKFHKGWFRRLADATISATELI